MQEAAGLLEVFGCVAAFAAAESITGVVSRYIIAGPSEETEKMLRISAI